jgi:hypothetical protein
MIRRINREIIMTRVVVAIVHKGRVILAEVEAVEVFSACYPCC